MARVLINTIPQAAIRSNIKVTVGVGHGSTNTVIRRFTLVVDSAGSDITYSPSSTLGDSFTLNTDGIYAIEYQEAHNAAPAFVFGISVNSNQLTTGIGSITAAHRAGYMIHPGGGTDFTGLISATIIATAGTVVRAHNQPTLPLSTAGSTTMFRITKVGN
jgi:hypothetical protein